VHLEQFGCVGGGEDGRKVGCRVGLGWGHKGILPFTALLNRDS
jgi:hypothetical protein